MSWLRSAVNKAVEVGNKNNLTRTVKSYADSVVHHAGQAVSDGAKLFQDRLGSGNYKNFQQCVKKLEEAAVLCRGSARVELMRRWVAVLKEIEKSSGTTFLDKDTSTEQQQLLESPRRQSMVLYYDSDAGGELMTFRDVFLYSQALEGISICMILEAPNEDEVSLLLELFGFCLTGGKEVHYAIVSSIQDLAKAFSGYQDEVLVKREELLQFAEGAITGLKLNADLQRIDAQVSILKKQIETRASHHNGDAGHQINMKQSTASTIEALKDALAHIRVCSRLEGLLLKKKDLKYGDTAEIHAQKVDKLKVLSESLAVSSSKAEKRISDNRIHKEDAFKFRVSKVSEVSEIEKELTAEISGLEKQREELEAQLLKVNISLSAAQARLRNATEERDQFFEANDQIVAHLKTKEDELAKSIDSCRAEVDVITTWINFLEDTWSLRCSHVEKKEEEISAELEKHEGYFTNLVIQLLSSYEKELRSPIDRIRNFVENLKSLSEGLTQTPKVETGDSELLNPRRNLEEEYLDFEAKIITTFSVVDNMRQQFYAEKEKISSKENLKIKELFDNLGNLREEFDSIQRPYLEIENPTKETNMHSVEASGQSVTNSITQEAGTVNALKDDESQMLDTEAELAKLESEVGKINKDYSTEEIGEWDFDELDEFEKELKSGDSSMT